MTLTARAAAAGLPTTLDMGGIPWTLTYHRSLKDEDGRAIWGDCDHGTHKIRVAWSKDFDVTATRLLHEIFHASMPDGTFPADGVDLERVVELLEARTYGPLRDMGWLKGGT